ncbi:DEAD/DEAH box helicase [Sandarakinorhabdus sp.]|uniref:DEAD/DEAH box helicase n=1 Tax=Sandarakinorhabdus sp. TaxID=1916663 RepID=UPI003341B45A
MSFADLGLSDALLRAIADSGYDTPTPIQRQAIPSVLMGKDIIGIAQTGTGKTASFVLPMIDILAEGRSRALMPRSLILEPTRELAQQVAENFDKYGKYHKLSMALLIGGVSMGDQLAALEKGVDVLIATPGRLMDLFARGKILLSGCALLVIDEADRMLDMGFIPDIEQICSKLPKGRQTLLFSATMPPPIKKLSDQFLTDPKSISVARAASANTNITQWVVETTSRGKRDVLRDIIDSEALKTAIIFCNKKTMVRELAETLKRARLPVGQIHGDMEQSDRIRELDRFKSGAVTILVASDVAARGLDIPGVSHVINYDVPWHPDDYVHRIGRTGRAGRTGIAFSLATPDDAENLAEIEKLTQHKIARWIGGAAAAQPAARLDEPAAAEPSAADPGRPPNGRGGRKRKEAVSPEASQPVEQPQAAAPASDDTETAPAEARSGDRRRGGKRRSDRKADAQPAPTRSAEPPPARSDRARAPERGREREPARPDRAPRAEPPVHTPTHTPARHAPRPTARDPLANYRAIASSGQSRHREDDGGERFVGFGPEGVPDFLSRPIKPSPAD